MLGRESLTGSDVEYFLRDDLAGRQSAAFLLDLVEVGVAERLDGRESSVGFVDEQLRDELEDFGWRARPEDVLPGEWLDLGEIEAVVFWVHVEDLVLVRSPEDFDYFNELVDAAVSGEDGLAKEKLGDDATDGPNVNLSRVL